MIGLSHCRPTDPLRSDASRLACTSAAPSPPGAPGRTHIREERRSCGRAGCIAPPRPPAPERQLAQFAAAHMPAEHGRAAVQPDPPAASRRQQIAAAHPAARLQPGPLRMTDPGPVPCHLQQIAPRTGRGRRCPARWPFRFGSFPAPNFRMIPRRPRAVPGCCALSAKSAGQTAGAPPRAAGRGRGGDQRSGRRTGSCNRVKPSRLQPPHRR